MSDYETGWHQATTAATPGSLEPIHTHTLYIYTYIYVCVCVFRCRPTDIPGKLLIPSRPIQTFLSSISCTCSKNPKRFAVLRPKNCRKMSVFWLESFFFEILRFARG